MRLLISFIKVFLFKVNIKGLSQMKKRLLFVLAGLIMMSMVSAQVSFVDFFPKSANIGDVQLNLRILNLGNETLSNVYAIVSGNGFSTYNVIPADSISINEKGYIFVFGNLRYSGNVSLEIKILGQAFHQNVSVANTEASRALEDELKRQKEKDELIQALSVNVTELENKYDELVNLLDEKQNDDYDVSKIKLDELKNYVRTSQANLLSGNPDSALVNLRLGIDEYNYEKNLLNNVKKISIAQRLKNNALLFSTITGAILAFFAIYELVLKKGSYLAKKVVRRTNKKVYKV